MQIVLPFVGASDVPSLNEQHNDLRKRLIAEMAPIVTTDIKSVSSDTTMSVGGNTMFLVDTTTASVTMTLVDAKQATDQTFIFKKIDASGNSVIIASVNGQLIDAATTSTISTQYTTRWIASNGSAWWII